MADNYTITSTRQTNVYSPSTGFAPAVEVYFSTPKVGSGSVTVPLSAFDPETVAQLVEERVATLEAIHAL